MSHNPKELPNVHAYLDIIGVFLENVPIQDVPVPKAERKEETWEQFRADAMQAWGIIKTILSPADPGYDLCRGKIIDRFVRVINEGRGVLRKE